MDDFQWNEESQCTQLYECLSEGIKDELVHNPNDGNTLASCIEQYINIDNRLKTRCEEWKQSASWITTPKTQPTVAIQRNLVPAAATPLVTPVNPTNTASGYYGLVPMDLWPKGRQSSSG